MTEYENLGAALSHDGPMLTLWRELPSREFVRLDDTHAFARDHGLVVVKRRDLINGAPVTATPLGVVGFCRVELLSCIGVPVAYAITSIACRMRVRETYCTWSLKGECAHNAAPLFNDGTLVLVGDDGAIVGIVGHRVETYEGTRSVTKTVLGRRRWTVPA